MPSAVQDAVRAALDRVLEIDPVLATRLGDHRHDDRLPEGGAAEVQALVEAWRSLESALEPHQGLDADVGRYAARWFRLADLQQLLAG